MRCVSVWQDQEVFIYSLKDMCPLSQPQKLFSCPAIITCLCPVPQREQVTHTHSRRGLGSLLFNVDSCSRYGTSQRTSPPWLLQNPARVFAGMSDGLVAVYSLLDGLPVEGEAYLCSHTLNKTMFGLKDSDPRQNPYPVRCMVLVGSGSQVSRQVFSTRPAGALHAHLRPLSLCSSAVVLQRSRGAGPGLLEPPCGP